MRETFYLNLTLAILYQAGLDRRSKHAFWREDAALYLRSDFARLARNVLSENRQSLTFTTPAVAAMELNLRKGPSGEC